MKNLRTIVVGGIVAGCLIVPGISAVADTKDGNGHHDERRDGYHGRGLDHHERHDKHNYGRDVHRDNRGHHDKP